MTTKSIVYNGLNSNLFFALFIIVLLTTGYFCTPKGNEVKFKKAKVEQEIKKDTTDTL